MDEERNYGDEEYTAEPAIVIPNATIAENIRKWVVALRSGKYQQGTGCLRDADDRYCCLGVGGEVLEHEWRQRDEDTDRSYVIHNPKDGELGLSGTLPQSLAAQLGIDARGSVAPHDDGFFGWGQSPFYEMNDSKGMSFESIADKIEQKLLPHYL